MKKIDEAIKIKVVNWMREEKDGVIQLRTAKEAKKEFNLDVTERAINGWVAKRGVTAKEIFQEARELKKTEIVETFISMKAIRGNFRRKAIKMIMDVTKNVPILDDLGQPILDGDGKEIKTPSIPNVKVMQAINALKEAIDNFTGFSDLENLEKMEQQANDSIRDFKHKKKYDEEKLRIEDEKNETKLLELEIKNLELFVNEEEVVNDGLVEVIGGTAKEVWGDNNAEKT